MKDGEQYQLLLDLYEKNLKLLETAQMAWEPYIEDPGVRQKFIKTRDHIFNDLEQPMGILEQLDILETRKTGLPNEKKRRAQLKARQERIEKLTGRPADNRG